jgi:PAS domain S-box-containing protein
MNAKSEGEKRRNDSDPAGTEAESTQLRLAEEALKVSEGKFRAVAEAASDAIVSLDSTGRVVFWNYAAEIMFGYASHEVTGSTFERVMPEPLNDVLSKTLKSATGHDSGDTPRRGMIESVGRRKDGGQFPVEMSVSSWKSGNENYLTAVVRDITERRSTQVQLEEEKKLLDVTLSSIGDAVVTIDADGKILLFNKAAEKMTGWQVHEAVGQNAEKILCLMEPATGKSITHALLQIADGNAPTREEVFRLVTREEVERTVSLSCAPLVDRDNMRIGAVIALSDISDKLRMEEELFRARKLESIGVLAGGIAHDFNNILTGIVTNLFMAKMNVNKDSEGYHLITEAESAAFRASKLTKQLLTFAKGGAPVKESASIGELIEESVGFSLSGSNVDCRLDLDESLWPVEIDRGQIDQVLNNLILNADQAMPDGGTVAVRATNVDVSDTVSDSTEVRLPLKPGKYVKISIRDEGIGIPEKNIHRIFDPYFTTKQKGNGLGLTTVYSIVRKHSGYITVRSKLGEGSTFIFYLPACVRENDTSESDSPQLPKGIGKILVMDDDEVVRVVIERLLKSKGYDVQCVSHGAAALEAYEASAGCGRAFDAVIMDLTIPGGMGGKDTVKRLLARFPDARVIVSSGYSNDPVMADYRKYGFCGVIRKPFSIEEFTEVLTGVMGGESAGEAS